MRVLSFDPGFERLGVAVVERVKGRDALVHSECVRTKSSSPFAERLRILGDASERFLREYSPDAVALETLLWGSNHKTAMRVAEVCGVLIYTAASSGLPVYEYTPLEIKVAVAGYGRAGKDQVARMVKTLLGVDTKKRLDDEIDAIAVCITCLARENHR